MRKILIRLKRSTPKSTKRKITLKSIIKSDPDEGLAHFLLGNVYLTQRVVDSAKISYQNGLRAKDDEHLIISD
jgi:Tfp pilus assembly protein PilF